MNGKLKHNNHYVSESYLKMWTNNKGKLYVYNRIVPNEKFKIWREKYPSEICKIDYLYIYVDDNGKLSDLFENIFSISYENDLNNILKKVDKLSFLNEQDIDILMKFIGAQRFKTKKGYFRIHNNISNWMMEAQLIAINSIKHTSNAGKKQSLLKNLPMKLSIIKEKREIIIKNTYINGKNLWLFTLERIVNNLYKELKNKEWNYYIAPEDYTWFTSDEPVIFASKEGIIYDDFEKGVKSANLIIIVPLSPKVLLVSGQKNNGMIYEVKDIEEYKFYQKIICESSLDYIISSKYDDSISEYTTRIIDQKKYLECINFPTEFKKQYEIIERQFCELNTE